MRKNKGKFTSMNRISVILLGVTHDLFDLFVHTYSKSEKTNQSFSFHVDPANEQ